MVKLEVLSAHDCETIRQWRNEDLAPWRTPYLLTDRMQEDFYESMVCNRLAPHRYWAVLDDFGILVAMVGITNIQWENSVGEITLIVNPARQKEGIGLQAVKLALDQAFNYLNLNTVFGECYMSNPAVSFWKQVADKYSAFCTGLPQRKFWGGKYWGSFYFSIDRQNFEPVGN